MNGTLNVGTRLESGPHQEHRFTLGLLRVFVLLSVALCSVVVGTYWTTTEVQSLAVDRQARLPGMAERWGVEVESMRVTAAGYMIDFRYRVVDAEKAVPLFKRKVKPYLIEQKSGATFAVPAPAKTGPLRNSNAPKVDRTYVMFFGNPGRFIKQGDKVTVVIGEFRAEDIVVQ